MSQWISYRQLHRLFKLHLQVVTKEPLHIGTGGSANPFDPVRQMVVRIAINGIRVPVILGSSLKGVLRSASELACSDSGMRYCTSGHESCGIKYKGELQEAFSLEESKVVSVLEKFCVICKLFGTAGYSSRLNVTNAIPTSRLEGRMVYRTGIGVNRITGSVSGSMLFDVEAVPPGIQFECDLFLTNSPNYLLGLLAKSLDYLNKGVVKLGGLKSRGFGLVNIPSIGLSAKMLVNGSYQTLRDGDRVVALGSGDTEFTFKSRPLLSELVGLWDKYVSRS